MFLVLVSHTAQKPKTLSTMLGGKLEKYLVLTDSYIKSCFAENFKAFVGSFWTKTQVNDIQLDTEIIEHDLYVLAGCFDNYNDYLPKLGLTPAEQADVRRVEFLERSHQSAMREALRLWRKQNPSAATFRTLLTIVTSLQKKHVAENIRTYIVEHIPSQNI